MPKPEIYISTDIESDGPIPGPNSMLSFASAAFDLEKNILGTFSMNLETLPGAKGNPETMDWWETQPEAWKACRRDPQDPVIAMPKYVKWVDSLPGKPVFVGYPAGFDFTFMYWYMINFAGRSPFGFSALDIKSVAMTMLNQDYRASSKRRFPKRWFDDLPHTHVALDDAIEQGAMFINMLQEQRTV